MSSPVKVEKLTEGAATAVTDDPDMVRFQEELES